MKLLVINGPNVNMIGIREPEIYGHRSFLELLEFIHQEATRLDIQVKCFQSNHEGAIIDKIQAASGLFDGIIINPAAFTHTSLAIADALAAANVPYIEVHLSDTNKREDFRKISFISAKALKVIKGHSFEGYKEAMEFFVYN